MREFMIAFNPSEAADITIIVNNKPVNDISILPFSIQDRALYIIDFFHNPSNNPKTTIKINQRTDQIKA